MDATGRIIRNDTQLSFIHETAGLVRPARQRSSIPASLPPILKRLNINIDAWLEQSQHFEK